MTGKGLADSPAGTTQNWNDRRTDLYRVRVRGPGGEREI